jgi:threonine dehydratase
MDRPSVTLADIQAARRRCAAIVRDTPLWPSIALTERLGVPVVLKCENMQRTGSFKIRGATNTGMHAPLIR